MMKRNTWSRCLTAGGVLVFGTLSISSVALAAKSRAVPAFSIRLEDQFLAELRYLPVSFVPASVTTPPSTTTTTTTTTTTVAPTATSSTTTTSTTAPTTTTLPPSPAKSARALSTKLVRGSFRWRFSALPGVLRQQWRVGTANVVLRGALMRFQSVHALASTGNIDGTTWRTLFVAILKHEIDPATYNYVYVSKSLPETAKLYANGALVYKTLVNTGIANATTANGTYPVYLRYTTTTMSGVNPNGSPYHDTGIPWVSYFNGGDALHGFIRSSYGYPQSLGCVEMTFNSAASIWPRTPIGTLVSVQ